MLEQNIGKEQFQVLDQLQLHKRPIISVLVWLRKHPLQLTLLYW